MKKIFFAFAMLIGSITANAAEIKLANTSFDVVAGGTVVIPIQLDLTAAEDGLYKTFQLDAVLSNSNFSLSKVTMAAERKSAAVAGDQYLEQIAGKTFGIVGMKNAAVIVGTSGDFLYLTISAASATSGDVCTVTFSKAKGGDVLGVETDATISTTSITINVVDYVTIDENVAFTPIAGTYDAHLVRTFESGKYYTVCLPFAMTAAKRKAAWGSAMEAYTFASAEVGLTAAEDGLASLELKFTKLGNLAGFVANTPYIIKTSAAATDPEFASVAFAEGATVTTYNDAALTGTNIKFIGTYTPNTVVPENCLYLKGDKMYKSAGATKMLGTRAYFDISELYTFANDNGLNIDVKMNLDGFETAIGEIDADVKAEGWFDLNGRKLAQKPATKGVYINNGKKVVVK